MKYMGNNVRAHQVKKGVGGGRHVGEMMSSTWAITCAHTHCCYSQSDGSLLATAFSHIKDMSYARIWDKEGILRA